MRSSSNLIENHLNASEKKWFAVYTLYKHEKLVSTKLLNIGIEVFLPLQKLYRNYSKKKKIVELPLFNNYVFVKIVKDEFITVQDCPGVVNFVKFSKNLISIPELEIDSVKRVIGESSEISVSNNEEIHAGEYVEIISGNLSGLKGRLLYKNSKSNFLIELKRIGLNLSLQIDPINIRKISRSALSLT